MRQRSHVPELDGVRGVAVSGVMLMHFVGQVSPTNGVEKVVTRAANYGLWGVDLFFVLSGFLITGILFDAKGSERYFQSFYARRTLRIFPLYYALLFLLFVLLPRSWAAAIDPELLTARSLQGWVWPYLTNVYIAMKNTFAIPYVSHFWSLAVEEHFYLVWPLVVMLWSRTTVMRISIALGLFAFGLRVLLLVLGYGELAAFALTPCRLDGLCTGAWFALAARGQECEALLERVPRWIVTTGIGIAACSAAHAVSVRADVLLLPLRGYLLAILFGLVIFAVSSGDGLGRSRAFLRGFWLRWLGKYSYGLYVFHGLIAYGMHRQAAVERLTRWSGSHLVGSAVAVICGVASSIAISVASFELFERRLLQLKKWFGYDGRRAAVSGGATSDLGATHEERSLLPRAILPRSKDKRA